MKMYYAYATQVPATDTIGARIRVTIRGSKRHCAYDYAAPDPFAAAVESVVGPSAKVTFDADYNGGKCYEVED